MNFYVNHVEEQLIPFWTRALDHQNGGVYTCFNNRGDVLLNKNKYTWSQGRFLWIWSRIAKQIAGNKLKGEEGKYHEHLHKTVHFLEENVFLENGNCAFLLSEMGEKIESIAGKGFDTSFYADCFVVIGLAEYASLFDDLERFEKALTLYYRIEERLKSGEFRSEPYPIPAGYKSFSVYMIMLNVVQSLADVAESLNHRKQQELFQSSIGYMEEIMQNFCLENYRVVEMLPEDPSKRNTLLYRHSNPGHCIEAMWFVMHTARKAAKPEVIEKASKVIEKTMEIGWDQEFGGLFHFVDKDGGPPKGERTDSSYEKVVSTTWDTKLWWPHSEALYASLLSYTLTENERMRQLYEQVHAYVFNTFPNADKEVGEWIQIRDRKGDPIDKVVALPVKDPFHILRNMLLIMEI